MIKVYESGYWYAKAEYADGTEIERKFAYGENDDYKSEQERQQNIEDWLISRHPDCTYYSVIYVED